MIEKPSDLIDLLVETDPRRACFGEATAVAPAIAAWKNDALWRRDRTGIVQTAHSP